MSSCFFFSSRRRHTRFDCDWSSDVCSSDLLGAGRLITMAAGSWAWVVAGAGIPDRFMPGTTGRRLTSDSSAMAAVEVSDLDLADWAGCRWLLMSGSIPGGAADSTAATAMADSQIK